MNYTINKLDRRHKGFASFTHYIMPVWSSQLADKLKFFEWRNWCWETFGPGMEREMAIEFRLLHDADLRWAWHTNNGAKRLYFKSEKEVAWFNLKWSSE
jgi:hypothetical protein